jgi:signal transduction histidine kinase
LRFPLSHRRLPAITLVKAEAAVVVGVSLLVATLMITADHARTFAGARASLAALDTVLAEQTAAAFQNVELVVNDVARAVIEEGLVTPEELRHRVADRRVHDMLRARIAGVPQLDAVTIIANDGTLLNFSRTWPIPPVNVADRDYFQALREQPDGALFISEPVHNRGSGSWTVYLARRLGGPDGRLLGLVLGAIDLSYFQRFYASIHLAPGSTISLWRHDGQLLAVNSQGVAVGDRFDRSPRFDLTPGEQRVVRATDSLDGADRLVALTRLQRFDLVVSVSRVVDEVLAPWRTDAEVIGVGGIFRAGIILAVMALLIRRLADQQAVEEAVRARIDAERSRQLAEAALGEAQRLETIGRFTAGIAHDFNNLLAALLANAEMLRLTIDVGAKGTQHIDNICKVVDRGALLTRQLLTFSRQPVQSPHPLALGDLLAGFLPLLQTSVTGRVTLRLDPAPPELWLALADPGQIEQALLNLVLNARDAMPDGGEVTIGLANRTVDAGASEAPLRAGDYVAISVADCGTGMTPDVQGRAFEPFFTTKGRRGTGLGLSQVVGFVRQSGGDVRIDSAIGVGTRIELLLPRAVASLDTRP